LRGCRPWEAAAYTACGWRPSGRSWPCSRSGARLLRQLLDFFFRLELVVGIGEVAHDLSVGLERLALEAERFLAARHSPESLHLREETLRVLCKRLILDDSLRRVPLRLRQARQLVARRGRQEITGLLRQQVRQRLASVAAVLQRGPSRSLAVR